MEPWILIAAFVLDIVLGDPEWLPHPVRWVGKAATASENFWRKKIAPEFWGGAALAVSLVFSVWLGACVFLWGLNTLGGVFHLMGSVLLLYYCLSVRSLASEAWRVKALLDSNGLDAARRQLSRIVGRDTENLDREGVVRAAVETVAENFVDGILSPLFFALIGGPPAALAFKAVSTLDSMVGYKNERYRRFGTFSARLDDAANFIPARVSPIPIFFAAMIFNKAPFHALRICIRDGGKHSSPNAGIPEAAFAGALGVQLGGPNFYGGRLVEKPFIGDEGAPVRSSLILDAILLMAGASIITVAGCAALAVAWAMK
ncbi:MAG: cobalamin biosynthesis protein CobD [Nitrospinae bacterium]|nr:cobalamin biosynthesis protein CobD [Nitrospinota bacterium]